MPSVATFPFSGQQDALRRVRARVLPPPGPPLRAYIGLNLPRDDRLAVRAVYESLLPGWRYVGEGAGRMVFLEPRLLYVVKFPKHAVGARDNLIEAETYRKASGPMLNILTPVSAAAADGLWLEMQYGTEGIGGGREYDEANRAVFAAGLRCTDLKPDSYRKFGGQVRLVDYAEGGCLGVWGDDYEPAVATTGTATGGADLQAFVAALHDQALRAALARVAESGSPADTGVALVELDRLKVRLRAAHAAENPGSPFNMFLVPVDGLRAFHFTPSNPPFFDAEKARRSYAKDALNQLAVLDKHAVTQARLPYPTV